MQALPADLDHALVRREIPAGDPEQRRLPGPVLPDDGMDLAGAALHADVLQRLHCAEPLRDALQRQKTGFPGCGFVDTRSLVPFGFFLLLGIHRAISFGGTRVDAEA